MAKYVNVDAVIKSIEGAMDTVIQDQHISQPSKEIYLLGLKHAIDFIEVVPTIQVVECRGCTHWERGVCHNPNHRYLFTEENHFCGYGEVKQEEPK